MNRWQIYELLKGNRKISHEDIERVEKAGKEEIKEGVVEYLTTKMRK